MNTKIHHNFTALYVANDYDTKKNTIDMLRDLLSNIVCAKNAQEGLEKYNFLSDVDLIIADIDSSKKHDLNNMLKEIRKTDKKVLIVILSEYSNTQYLLETIKIGIHHYMLKPYTLTQLKESIQEVIEYHYNDFQTIKLNNDFVWNHSNCSLTYKDELIKLTKNELKLIDFLISSNQSIKNSQSIENFIFEDLLSNNKRIRNLISRLNSKFQNNLIESIYAQGYKIQKCG